MSGSGTVSSYHRKWNYANISLRQNSRSESRFHRQRPPALAADNAQGKISAGRITVHIPVHVPGTFLAPGAVAQTEIKPFSHFRGSIRMAVNNQTVHHIVGLGQIIGIDDGRRLGLLSGSGRKAILGKDELVFLPICIGHIVGK